MSFFNNRFAPQLMMSSMFGGNVQMMTGEAYRRAAHKKKAALQEDLATLATFVVRGVAAWRGGPTIDVTEAAPGAAGSIGATQDDLAASVKALSQQIAASSGQLYLRDTVETGLSWLTKKVVGWACESDEEIEMVASHLDEIHQQTLASTVATHAAIGAAGGASGQGSFSVPPAHQQQQQRSPLGPMGGLFGRRANGMKVGPTQPDGSFEIQIG